MVECELWASRLQLGPWPGWAGPRTSTQPEHPGVHPRPPSLHPRGPDRRPCSVILHYYSTTAVATRTPLTISLFRLLAPSPSALRFRTAAPLPAPPAAPPAPRSAPGSQLSDPAAPSAPRTGPFASTSDPLGPPLLHLPSLRPLRFLPSAHWSSFVISNCCEGASLRAQARAPQARRSGWVLEWRGSEGRVWGGVGRP